MGSESEGEIVERGDHSLDEGFKALYRETYDALCPVNTDYEILPRSKRVDALLIDEKLKMREESKVFNYFKVFNIIEFKSEKDPFRADRHMHKLSIYFGGVIEREKGATLHNVTFTLICTVKPKKLLNSFKNSTKIIRDGVYLIEGILAIPLYLIVPDELQGELDKELALLKGFSKGSERKRYLKEIIRSVSAGDEQFRSHLGYAFSLYRDEVYELVKKEGFNMTLIEKNMRFWIEYFNWKDEFIAEGEQRGLEKGEQKGRVKGRLEGKTEDARKMLDKGLDIEFIHEITGLSHDEIKALKG